MNTEPKPVTLPSLSAGDTSVDAASTGAETQNLGGSAQVNEAALMPTPATAASSSASPPDRDSVSPRSPEISSKASMPAVRTTLGTPGKVQVSGRLPNASVGKRYQEEVRQIFGDQRNRVASIKLSGLEGTGLIFDTEVLHGTPEKAGELTLKLTYSLEDTVVGHSDVTHPLALTINPDPTSLWKNLESNRTDFGSPTKQRDA
jgi:hypothetical protein